MGKGFFVDRDVLQNRWEQLTLPEVRSKKDQFCKTFNLLIRILIKEELLRFLSLCRMLYWPQVHWLKLFAVMVGSLNTVIH